MEDYKKKYEEANKRVAIRFGSDVARELFPDLYESEDELMRKEAIAIVRQYNIICEREGDKCYTADKVIAWLDKQKQKDLCSNCVNDKGCINCENGNMKETLDDIRENAERIRENCIHFLELQKRHHAATFEIEECIEWLKTIIC